MTFSVIQPVSLREQVVEQIRTAIIEGRLKLGDHIVENSLTMQLGVSRTPVREALILLERDGLVVSHPHRGSFVRTFTEADIEAVFTMRTTLENFAAEIIVGQLDDSDFKRLYGSIEQQQKAIQRSDYKHVRSIDMAFHQFIVDRSDHALLARNWRQIVAQIAAVLYIRAEAIPDYDEHLAIRDHTSIVDAFAKRDLDEVTRLNRQVNQRVADECKFSVLKLKKPSVS
jgi:DNA-binding GntR family transcriptional regulator